MMVVSCYNYFSIILEYQKSLNNCYNYVFIFVLGDIIFVL
jgi:hypothetical protein